MSIRVCLAGATGWVGRSLAPAIWDAPDMTLVSAVARRSAGTKLGDAISREDIDLTVVNNITDGLSEKANVLVDYTRPAVVMDHVMEAISRGVHAVIGTSGLTDAQYERIHEEAEKHSVGVLAAGNFAITAVLMQRLAVEAAKHVPSWEIIDYAHADKLDAPSGTTRELAYRLSKVRKPEYEVAVDDTQGLPQSRGGTVNDTQIHSVRLPGFIISAEIIFGLPDEKLTIRHEAGSGATPYVGGTMLAIRKVQSFTGLRRGLDTVMNF